MSGFATKREAVLATLSLGALMLLPDAALACPVCTGGGEESRTAFIVTTAGMSVLPLAMIGGLVWWIWRRTRADALASATEARTTPSPTPPIA